MQLCKSVDALLPLTCICLTSKLYLHVVQAPTLDHPMTEACYNRTITQVIFGIIYDKQ